MKSLFMPQILMDLQTVEAMMLVAPPRGKNVQFADPMKAFHAAK
ncbi:hypothetical protein ALO45_200137 [Pseudomonas syringae pv. syringae]|nr:hypothetical protein ALO45_200137 [Pseudomonas syringae pv. syringae]